MDFPRGRRPPWLSGVYLAGRRGGRPRIYWEFRRRVLSSRVRITIRLDLPERDASSLKAPWQILVDGRRTAPSLTTMNEVVECLMRLGVEPAAAQWHASRVTRTAPFYEFDLPPPA